MYYILELIKPGTWLDHKEIDEVKKHEINNLLISLVDVFYEANLALNLFNQEQVQLMAIDNDDYSIRTKAIAEIGCQFDHLPFDEKQFQQEIFIKKYLWRNGIPPQDIQRKKIFMYAKCFLFAMDNFAKFLNVINKREYNPPREIGIAVTDFLKVFPNLRAVRNSAHHLEDISRRLGKGKSGLKEFVPKSINNGSIKSDGGVLILNSLNNNKYGQTVGDGTFSEVEVSVEKLKEVNIILQKILNSYVWKGVKRHLPN